LAAASIDQLRADIGFDACDKSGERRLSDLRPIGGTAKMQFLAKGDEIPKPAQIETSAP
jgi:hypothetical protein